MRVIDYSLVLRARVVRVDLGFSLVDRDLSLGGAGDDLLETLHGQPEVSVAIASSHTPSPCHELERTSFSNTQVFSAFSCLRQCHIWWLFCSKHPQCARNCWRQFSLISFSLAYPLSSASGPPIVGAANVHARSAASNLPSLPQALEFALSFGLGLALHVVIIVGSAAVADEVGRAHQWRGTSSDLIDLGDVVGEGSGVDEVALVEPATRTD